MSKRHHVFLSYSRIDVEIMQTAKDKLQAEAITVWTDEGIEPGTPLWKDAIQNAIENSECLVVILTPDAKNSIWVKRELDYAEAHSKQVFPLLARGDVSSSVPFALIGAQYVDIRSDEHIGFGTLILTLKSHFNIFAYSGYENTTSSHENMHLVSLLIRSVQEQGSYFSLNEITAILDRAKYEIQNVYSRLVMIAKERGFITYEDITINISPYMNEPEIIDEIIRQLLDEKIEIAEYQELVRIQVLTKASQMGFVTYDEILNWITFDRSKSKSMPDFKLLHDVMDDLLEAGIEVRSENEDELYQEAVEYIKQINKASISILQRRFRIGYKRAYRILAMMQAQRVIDFEYDYLRRSYNLL